MSRPPAFDGRVEVLCDVEVRDAADQGLPVAPVLETFAVAVDEFREGLFLSVKLPESSYSALGLPFTEPTGYGLGKSGWVSANFGLKETPPVELLQDWIEESYRAIAPKKLVAQLKP